MIGAGDYSEIATKASREARADLSVKSLSILRWAIYVLCVAWMGAASWYVYFQPGKEFPDLAWSAYERSMDQKMNDCTGSFSERYECRSTLIRQEKVALFYWWAERVSIVVVPVFVVLTLLYFYLKYEARKAEKIRVVARLERMDKKAMEARQKAIDEGKRRAELARLKAEAKRREKGHIKHILIIDNDPEHMEPLTSALTRMHHEVGYVDSLAGALNNFKESAYDLVLIDIFKENMGGMAGVKQLRATEVQFKCIAMSEGFAKFNEGDLERVRERLGVDRVLLKPLDLTALQMLIDEVMAEPFPETAEPSEEAPEAAPEAAPERAPKPSPVKSA
jgi:CheY-like chemotaxis protein